MSLLKLPKIALSVVFCVHTLASMEEANKALATPKTHFLDIFETNNSAATSRLLSYLRLRDICSLRQTCKQLAHSWDYSRELKFNGDDLDEYFHDPSQTLPLIQEKFLHYHNPPNPVSLELKFVPQTIICLSSLVKFTLASSIIQPDQIELLEKTKTLQKLYLLPRSLIPISIKTSDIEQLPEAFTKLTQLKKLVIEHEFSSPERLVLLGALTKLRSLFLLGTAHHSLSNLLEALPKEISKLQSLSTLVLRGNQMINRGLMPLTTLTQLKKLDLSDNLLEEIPEALQQLQQLRVLILRDNSLKDACLPFLKNMPLLKALDLAQNQISFSESNGLPLLPNLKKLNLSANPLGSLNPLMILPKLIILKLQNLSCQKLPDGLGNLTQLEGLSLKINKLSAQGFAPLGKLTNLLKLDLSDNEIDALPEAIRFLTNLKTLNLSMNQLRKNTVPPLGNLTNLLDLDLSYNNLDAVPDSLAKLIWLTKLNLEGNAITLAGTAPLKQLRSLLVLDLDINAMTAEELRTFYEKQNGG